MRQKRELGITPGIIEVIAVAASWAIESGTAISQTVTTTSTVYQPSEEITEALRIQSSLNNLVQVAI